MEFKLNKIDTDIRKKIDEERKESKVHSGKAVNINKDLHDSESSYICEHEQKEERKKKKYFIIDGIRYNKKQINIQVEKNEKLSVQNSLGSILDTKK